MTTYDASDMECGELIGCVSCGSDERVRITTAGWTVIITCAECGETFATVE